MGTSSIVGAGNRHGSETSCREIAALHQRSTPADNPQRSTRLFDRPSSLSPFCMTVIVFAPCALALLGSRDRGALLRCDGAGCESAAAGCRNNLPVDVYAFRRRCYVAEACMEIMIVGLVVALGAVTYLLYRLAVSLTGAQMNFMELDRTGAGGRHRCLSGRRAAVSGEIRMTAQGMSRSSYTSACCVALAKPLGAFMARSTGRAHVPVAAPGADGAPHLSLGRRRREARPAGSATRSA